MDGGIIFVDGKTILFADGRNGSCFHWDQSSLHHVIVIFPSTPNTNGANLRISCLHMPWLVASCQLAKC
jgi:hypothetical protein